MMLNQTSQIPEIGVRGRLQSMSFPALLHWIGADGKTGNLVLNQGAISKKISFRQGRIVSTSSNDPREYLGQFLVSQELISEEQLRSAMDLQKRSRMMLGKILLEGKIIQEKELKRQLIKKAEEMIYNLFLWEQGVFRFEEDEIPRKAEVSFTLEIAKILKEGERRHERLRKIRRVFPSDQVVLAKTGKIPTKKAFAQPVVKKIFLLVDGHRSIADLCLEVRLPEFPLSWILYQMFERGYFTFAEEIVSKVPTRETANSVLIDQTRGMLKNEEFEPALVLLEQIRIVNPDDPEIPDLLIQAESGFRNWLFRNIVPPKAIPVLTRTADALLAEKLTSEEGFILSRLTGDIDVESLINISPIREIDILRILKNLSERGIVSFRNGGEDGNGARTPVAAKISATKITPESPWKTEFHDSPETGNNGNGSRPEATQAVYNRLGWGVGWLKGNVVFDNEGVPRAFIQEGSVFHFNGFYLGEFETGFFRDRTGRTQAFLGDARGGPLLPSMVPPSGPPEFSPVPRLPVKSRKPSRPATPSLGWSTRDFQQFLRIT